jgi:hypothetical protein
MLPPQDLLQKYQITLPDYRGPGRYRTICPKCSATRHKKNDPCLGVTVEVDKAFWHCHHCSWSGPTKGDGAGNGASRDELTSYIYRDRDGTARFRKVRNLPGAVPRFWLQRPNGDGTWTSGAKGIDTKLIYRADEVASAIEQGQTICNVEGEKDADNLWSVGFAATCNAHGASESGKRAKWTAAHSAQLAGADLVVLNDNDAPGYAHADATCKLSAGVARRVRRLDLARHWPEIPEGGDVSDWLAAGHGRDELAALIDGAPDYVAEAPQRKRLDATEQAPEFSDEALALCFAEQHQAQLRYVAFWSKWLIWRTCRWIDDSTLHAFSLARQIARTQATACDFPRQAAAIASAKTVAAIERLAKADRRIAAADDQWDADLCAFNTPKQETE